MTEVDRAHVERIPIIDVDVHTAVPPMVPAVTQYLPARWREHIETVGFRGLSLCGERPRQRMFAARTDAWTPSGGAPGSEPEFAREQLLDRYDLSGAIMNDIFCYQAAGSRSCPDELAIELARAYNEYRVETWLSADPRWYGSITVPYETREGPEEIRRCKESEHGDRWVQLMMAPDNERPAGHPRYWPIYEAAEHYGIPVSFHVLASRAVTGTGIPNYYLEEHTQFADTNFPLVASLIFEGVFDRFPNLKIGMIELAWSWVVPFAWRLDRAHRLMRDEVAHLQRKPSEYLADHFWFSTQPMEEPEQLEWVDDVYQLFEDTMGDKLMYSSDYPHWDFDEPTNLPATLPLETRRRILGQTASRLYNIPLRENSGLVLEHALA
jgi:predicted TIM-barrel fold metal-dependent hydrolase